MMLDLDACRQREVCINKSKAWVVTIIMYLRWLPGYFQD